MQTVSDHFITFVPVDPLFLPSELRILSALDLAHNLFPAADAIEEIRSDGVRLFDAGSDLTRVLCPACRQQLPTEWWKRSMDSDYIPTGFQLERLMLPCCGATTTLNDLGYEWPQAFGKFGLRIMNANVGRIEPEVLNALESELSTRLRVIRTHI